VWDAIVLLLSGVVIIVAADAETESITDPAGSDLDAHGDRAREILQRGGRPADCFVGYKGIGGSKGILDGELLMQMGQPSDFIHTVLGGRDGSLDYAVKHGLSEMRLSCPIAASERIDLSVRDIATSKWSVRVGGSRDNRMSLGFETKLGTGRDRIRGASMTFRCRPAASR
jgi:hypothetical protein